MIFLPQKGRKTKLLAVMLICLIFSACRGKTVYDEAGYEINDTVYDISIGKYMPVASQSTFRAAVELEKGFMQQGETQQVTILLPENSTVGNAQAVLVSSMEPHKEKPSENALFVLDIGQMKHQTDASGNQIQEAYCFELKAEGIPQGIYDIRIYDNSKETAAEVGFISVRISEVNEIIQEYEENFNREWEEAHSYTTVSENEETE